MVIGVINCYNDMPLIVDCINSIIDKVDYIIAIDGRYLEYPGISWDSTDGTLEYICSLDKAEVITTVNYSEVEKRNKYLEQLNDGDIVLNLDTDEVLIGNIPELKSDFGIIELWDGHCNKKQPRATRFFKYRDGMRYNYCHYTLYWQGVIINKLHQVINKDFSFAYIKDFHLEHRWHLRSHERQHDKSIYYKKLIKKESGFIK